MENRITIYDLSKQLGISTATINRAFNPSAKIKSEKRKLILETAAKYGYSPNKIAAGLSRNPIKIGTILVDLIPAFYNELIKGIKSSHEELLDLKVESVIRIINVNDNIENIDHELIRVLDEFSEKKFDGIIINYPVASQSIQSYLNSIIDNGIPIVTLNYELSGIKRLFSSINNCRAAGRMAAQMLSFTSKGNQAVIFSGNMALENHQSTIKGFREEAVKQSLELVGVYDNRDDPDLAYKNTEKVLKEHPNLNGIYINSANSIPVCKRLEELGRSGEISLVASDVFPELASYISSRVVSATIYQNPFMQAKNAFLNLYYHITENRKIPERLMITPQIVISSNIQMYLDVSVT
jgi:Transcriptional regulators